MYRLGVTKKHRYDLRSDTATKPCPGMLSAMVAAEVGDDVFGEDPSVNALQELCASISGFEAALFCASGTMTNQVKKALKLVISACDSNPSRRSPVFRSLRFRGPCLQMGVFGYQFSHR